MNLTSCIFEKTQNNLNKTALIYIEDWDSIQTYSYKAVFEKIEVVASFLLEKNFQKGDKILLRLPSNPNVIFCFFGAILAGCVPILISRFLVDKEIEYIIQDSKCKGVIWEDLSLPSLAKNLQVYSIEEVFHKSISRNVLPSTQANDPAFMIYTSGTTANPKGVIHAQRNILGRIPIHKEWIGVQEGDILLHAGELNWTYTLGVGVMDVWFNKATSILVGKIRQDPTNWTKIIQKYNVNIIATVPSLYRRILKYSHNELNKLNSLRHALSAGESLSKELYLQWIDLTQKPMYEALGMTEISTYISSGPNVPVRLGSVGKPQKGRNVRILSLDSNSCDEIPLKEVGLIAVHKSDLGLMLGYQNPLEEKDVFRGEWFIGGDLAYKDEDGYFWFQGRNNEIMKSFGYRVSPLEVEKVLLSHPAISEAAVCEIQKNKEISLITAFIVRKENENLSEKDILEYCKQNLADYKVPKEVIFLNTLPHTHNGKVLKKELKQNFDFKI